MGDETGKVQEQHEEVPDDGDGLSASTLAKQRNLKPWQPGQSGNPRGREKGSRNKLSEEFLSDLLVEWRENGPAALKAAAVEKPVEFCKMVAGLLPKQIQIKDELSDFTDEQLAALNALVASLIGDTEGEELEAGKATLQ